MKMNVARSWRVHLVQGQHRERVREGDAGDSVDLAVEYPLGETVPRGRHRGLLNPLVAFRIIGLIGTDDAARFIDPTFAADYVNLAIDNSSPNAAPRGRHRCASPPGIGRYIINLVHRYVRRPAAWKAGPNHP